MGRMPTIHLGQRLCGRWLSDETIASTGHSYCLLVDLWFSEYADKVNVTRYDRNPLPPGKQSLFPRGFFISNQPLMPPSRSLALREEQKTWPDIPGFAAWDWYKPQARLFLRRAVYIIQTSLGINAVTMTVQRFDIMHAAIAHSRLDGILASFLFSPDQPGAAAWHDTGYTIVDIRQFRAALRSTQHLVVFFTLTGFRHSLSICISNGWLPSDEGGVKPFTGNDQV